MTKKRAPNGPEMKEGANCGWPAAIRKGGAAGGIDGRQAEAEVAPGSTGDGAFDRAGPSLMALLSAGRLLFCREIE